MLARIVAEQGSGHWTKVAAHLPGRMGRQCRERWFNHLAPEVKKGEWSKEEDQLIVASVREFGTKWSLIQKKLPGRSDNSIKNRYYSAIRKAQRLEKRKEGGPAPASDGDASASDVAPTPPQGNSPDVVKPPGQSFSRDAAAEAGIEMRHTPQAGGAAAGGALTGAKRKQRAVSEVSAVALGVPPQRRVTVAGDPTVCLACTSAFAEM